MHSADERPEGPVNTDGKAQASTGPAPDGFGARVRDALAWRYGSQVIAQIITWGSTLLVVRLLDPSDYGLFAMSQVVLAALAFLNGWGFANSLIQQESIGKRDIGQAFAMLLVLNFGLAAAQILIAPYAALYYSEPLIEDMLHIQALLFLTTPFIALPSALLSRELSFRTQAIANMIAAIAGAITALVMAWYGFGVWALVWAPIVSFAVRAVALTIGAWPLTLPVFDLRGAGAMVSYGGAMTLCQMLWIVQSQSDIFIAGRTFEPYDLGLYAEALFLTLIVTGRFLPPLNEVAFPAYSELHKAGHSLAPYFLRSMRSVAIVTGPIYIGLALTAPEAIATLFGEKWLPMVPIVASLALIMPFRSLEIICTPATNATGRPRIYVYTSLAGAVLFTAGFLVGVEYGAMGLVHAWWVASPLLLAFTLALTLPVVGVTVWEWGKAIWPAIVACAAMAAAVSGLRMILPDWPAPLGLAALAATGAATYAAVIWFGWRGVVHESWAMIRQRPASGPQPGGRMQTTAG
ncbi:MAG: lipopolysaccharide biosynthesis protein [Alphaproteobacteria bacterium]|nr:lipopolysaccharide biosynthesis protein [Alphaproteobacteria bacterium]